MFEFLRKKRKDKNLVFWKRINGHDLYHYKDYATIPVHRTLMLRMAFNQMGLGLTVGDIIACSDKINEFIDKGESSKAAFINGHLKLSAESYMGAKVAIGLGGIGVLVDDEPQDEYSEHHADIKRKIIKESSEAQFFFINKALDFLIQQKDDLTDLSKEVSYQQLVKRIKIEKQFLTLIGSDISKNLWTPLIQK